MEETSGSLFPQSNRLLPESSTLERDIRQKESDTEAKHRNSHQSVHPGERNVDLELAKTNSITESMSLLHECLFVTLCCSAQFVTQIGLVGTQNILHIIGSDLGITDPGVLAWLIAGYSLTVGTFILLSGRCGDLFGYRIMLITGYVWFALWNIVAGCSVYLDGKHGQTLFIFARVFGGIGPAILLPNALGLLGATYKEGRRKDMVFSLFGACAPGMRKHQFTCVPMLKLLRRCCCWWNIRSTLVPSVVAMGILDLWHRPICPRNRINIHPSLRTFRRAYL